MANSRAETGLSSVGTTRSLSYVELAVQGVETQRRIGLDRVGVLAGESFELADCGLGGLRGRGGLGGMRRGRGRSGRAGQQGKAENGESETNTEQVKTPPWSWSNDPVKLRGPGKQKATADPSTFRSGGPRQPSLSMTDLWRFDALELYQ